MLLVGKRDRRHPRQSITVIPDGASPSGRISLRKSAPRQLKSKHRDAAFINAKGKLICPASSTPICTFTAPSPAACQQTRAALSFMEIL